MKYFFSAKKSGWLKTPLLNWTTFDPDLKSYVNHELEPIKIKVQEKSTVKEEEQKFFDSPNTGKTQQMPTSEKKEELSPLPDNVSLYKKHKYLFWSFIYTLLALMIFWKHRIFFIRKKKLNWSSLLNQAFSQAQQDLDEGQYRKAGTLLLNLMDQVWLKTMGTGGREMDKLLEKCPPSLRKELGLEIKKLKTDLEDLSFSKRPESHNPWNPDKVEKLMKRCRITIESIIRYS